MARRLTKVLKSVLFSLSRKLIYFLVFCATLYMYLNTFELTTLQDIDFVSAIRRFDYSYLLPRKDIDLSEKEPNLTGALIGNYGQLIYLRIPAINRRISLIPALKKNGQFLIFTNHAHYLSKYRPQSKELEALFVYTDRSWRTLNHLEKLHKGDNLLIDTKRNWTYLFKVGEIKIVPLRESYIYPRVKYPQLIIIVQDRIRQEAIVIRGEYRSIINKSI